MSQYKKMFLGFMSTEYDDTNVYGTLESTIEKAIDSLKVALFDHWWENDDFFVLRHCDIEALRNFLWTLF